MELVQGIESLSHSIPNSVVTIGNFDGVHLGHQRIIEIALEKARSRRGKCIAFTFRPHPQIALRPTSPIHLLCTYDEKIALLKQYGIDITVEQPFNLEFSKLEPEQFFKEVILNRLKAEVIVVGYDFAFGKERHGHLDALGEYCRIAGVELIIVQPQKVGDEVVSSSKIRKYLLSGQIEEANRLLGRSFSYQGTVIHGEGRGRKIGYPTANLKLDNKLALPYGVYATWAFVNGSKYLSVTNVGVRPTFQQGLVELPALVETHLLDVNINLYDNSLKVDFVCRLREEKKFGGIDSLKSQIAADVFHARRVLTNGSEQHTI